MFNFVNCILFTSLMEFVPPNKRTEDYFKSVLEEKGLHDVVKLHLAQVIMACMLIIFQIGCQVSVLIVCFLTT